MATKKKELLEQDAPVTETVMSEGETLLADNDEFLNISFPLIT